MVVKLQSRQKEEVQLVWWVGKMSNFDRQECFFISHILPGINVSFHHEHNCLLCLTKFICLNLTYQTINTVWWQIGNWFWKALKNSVFLLRGTSVQKKTYSMLFWIEWQTMYWGICWAQGRFEVNPSGYTNRLTSGTNLNCTPLSLSKNKLHIVSVYL